MILIDHNPHNVAIPIKRKTMNLLWAHNSISLLITETPYEIADCGLQIADLKFLPAVCR
jgi:hypothetical protein